MEYSGPQRQREIRILRQIAAQPQPFYSASPNGNTPRLYTGASIPNLKREVRKIFTKDWPTADLKSSQLAICAWMWDIGSILGLLQSGRSDRRAAPRAG